MGFDIGITTETVTDHRSGISANNCVRWHAGEDDRTGGDNRSASDRDAGQHNSTVADPDVVLNFDQVREPWCPFGIVDVGGPADCGPDLPIVMIMAPDNANIVGDQNPTTDLSVALNRAKFSNINVLPYLQAMRCCKY